MADPENSGKFILAGDPKWAFWDDFSWRMRTVKVDMLGKGDKCPFSLCFVGRNFRALSWAMIIDVGAGGVHNVWGEEKAPENTPSRKISGPYFKELLVCS